MSFNIIKIKGDYNINPPEKKAFTIETSNDDIKLHSLLIASGKRGGGKTVAIANLIRAHKAKGYFDRVLLISPTYESNREIWDIAGIEEDEVYLPTKTVLKDIKAFIEQERTEWDIFLSKKASYHSYSNDMKHKPLASFTPEKLIYYLDNKFFTEPPKWKYATEQPPRLGLIIDDALGTDLMLPSAGLTRFIIAHRHWGQGLGISVFMAVQSYCAKEGLARPIRENCTHLMLFKCKDLNQRKKILEEIGADVDLDKFNELYDFATEKPFEFLFVDFAPKEPTKVFRKCFNEYLQ